MKAFALFATSVVSLVPSCAQSIPYEQADSPISAFDLAAVEPGDSDPVCSYATIPKGRCFAMLIYDLTYAEFNKAGQSDTPVTCELKVIVGDVVLHEEIVDVSPALFSGTPEPVEGNHQSGPGLRYRKRIEKVLDISQFAQNGSPQMQIYILANRHLEGGAFPYDFDELLVEATLHTDVRFVLTESSKNFLPRDSLDAAAECSNAANQPLCFPIYEAKIVPEQSGPHAVRGRIRFRLTGVSNLIGKSTNFGDTTTPDYKIETARQEANLFDAPVDNGSGGQNILTQRANLSSAKLVVTSLDYGGTAQLRAELLMGQGASPIQAEIDQAANPQCNCASLPFDRNGNEIADSWEETFAGVGGSLDPNGDAEPGYAANSPKGDGYTNHDEYRGFHYVERNGTQPIIKWVRTDPKTKQDVFFWDPGGRFYQRLPDILAVQGGGNPIHVYREVNAKQANAKSPMEPIECLNKNSRQSRQQGFAVVYVNASLPAGVIGDAGNTLNDEQYPIRIDLAQIGTISTALAFPTDVLLAEVIAHETGHKFARRHPLRPNCCQELGLQSQPSNASQVSSSEFGIVGTNRRRLYARFATYLDPGAGNMERVADSIELSPHRGVRANTVQKFLADASDGVHLFSIDLNERLPQNPRVGFQIQEQKLMDWTPRTTLRTFGQWQFAQRDIEQLCVHPRCRQ